MGIAQDLLEDWEQDVHRIEEHEINTLAPEMDNVLDGRDLLEEVKSQLSPRELEKLDRLDAILRKNIDYVWQNLNNPVMKRRRLLLPHNHWWWYYDTISEKAISC
ncbi:hypothetical protein HKBW3S03_00277 [Candidatus Hakubella thermalkaliphila]|uniref:Uncharacterized protein n=1 Tax=Candidatus Hakubella thermalkaliphila TaxID=2754717 RepID=A0A6V8NET9_9ACTN|nr:hypothetical protein [Candidatus Hakubella thermalkaliphila]MBT9171308.1 hypothetical protein [Actinomycetota bacterium]GFP18772.1 hypothetical protein HKBW3S03_00277 [Candidatus Hakubella thermalkaliphila]GFP23807.1 hypothetical protein HKBW3S09_01272 [Candidatus Hakubella thermalkaliphila]GFP29101.1 hypothetical protein HKBW3S34_00019 [Candidatus Hakubella thermalkaliphila]GFP38367.1 hypothetical protein HKBW3S47_00068 [Candidatus Hakubella thermalkaliphila]